MPAPHFNSFHEFWPYYLREHSRPATRTIHFLGTSLALAVLVVVLVQQRWWWLAAVPIVGYGLAWVSHLFIERNRPATFKYPLWSLWGDLRMWWLIATGRMRKELARQQIEETAE